MAITFPEKLSCKVTSKSFVKTQNRILRTDFGGGYSQVVADGLNHTKDIWTIQVAPLQGEDLALMQDFLEEVTTVNWFHWQALGDTKIKQWRIKENSIKRTILNTEKYTYSFTAEQVFELV